MNSTTVRHLLLSLTAAAASLFAPLRADLLPVEKQSVTLGFIKLTDCAPLVIAKELRYFEDEGISVKLEAQSNWKVLLDRVVSGELDGAHMLAGQPLAATIGYGTEAHILVSYSLDYNGNGITVSNKVWEEMKEHAPALRAETPEHPIGADPLRPVVDRMKSEGDPMRMGMVFPVSTHNYELRYWLAAGGIHPGFYTRTDNTGQTEAEVLLSVTPPPQMPATMDAGTIEGYCVGEPWNQQAVAMGIGVPVTTNYDIWKNNPEKVFGVTKEWAEAHPHTWTALTKALIRAGKWLDASPENRVKAAEILSRPEYVGADEEVIANSMTGTFEFNPGYKRPMPDFNVFYRYHASYPFYSDAVWFLTQMRRWGQIREDHPDAWYHQVANNVYRPDVYRDAMAELIDDTDFEPERFADIGFTAEDLPETDGFKPATDDFIDGRTYDGREPNAYINSFDIGLKTEVD